jgi:hypothetical protein
LKKLKIIQIVTQIARGFAHKNVNNPDLKTAEHKNSISRIKICWKGAGFDRISTNKL